MNVSINGSCYRKLLTDLPEHFKIISKYTVNEKTWTGFILKVFEILLAIPLHNRMYLCDFIFIVCYNV